MIFGRSSLKNTVLKEFNKLLKEGYSQHNALMLLRRSFLYPLKELKKMIGIK